MPKYANSANNQTCINMQQLQPLKPETTYNNQAFMVGLNELQEALIPLKVF